MDTRSHGPRRPWRSRVVRWVIVGVIGLALFLGFAVAALFLLERLQALAPVPIVQAPPVGSVVLPSLTPTILPSAANPLPAITASSPAIVTPTLLPAAAAAFDQGLVVVAMAEGADVHLFAFLPRGQMVRLTGGSGQDIDPVLSPDGKRIAYASNRDGHWDLYLMTLADGTVSRLTDTPEYDGTPSWSPDGQWLVYESFIGSDTGGSLDIFIRPIDGSQPPFQLTDDVASDNSPNWSPGGRKIAFISTRSGESEVWIADLDKAADRFINISRNQEEVETHPAWSPDGRRLVWGAAGRDGVTSLRLWNADHPEIPVYALEPGDRPAWSPGGEAMLAELDAPNRSFVTGYALTAPGLALPVLQASGPLDGIDWGRLSDPAWPPPWTKALDITPTPLFQVALAPNDGLQSGRQKLVTLPGVEAPYPLLQDRVDEAFAALKARTADGAGWDFLSALADAYQPLTSPMEPGLFDDWLLTGRAFRFNTSPADAGWLVIARENYGPYTYWRVYLRTRYQDGSQGRPLKELPWNLAARYSGEPLAYEQGGALAKFIPPGYWYDFTHLAQSLGWERAPALRTWLNTYSGTRYNEFIYTEGQDWFTSMLELYPRAALDTPTPVSSPTPTATPTDTPTPTPTNTPTRWLSPTFTPPTRWPTYTPKPSATRWPTRTPTNTPTPPPTPTPPENPPSPPPLTPSP